MNKLSTKLQDFFVLEPRVFGDDRGFFLESWNAQTFEKIGISSQFVQDNHSFSSRGVLRGLHYQLIHPQGKLVWVVEGEVLDVAVDLRLSSPTFGLWDSVVLSGQNKLRAWVPPGFAHGFHVLSPTAHFCYKCTQFYDPKDERCILWSDTDLNVDWGVDVQSRLVVSDKDRNGIRFADAPKFP